MHTYEQALQAGKQFLLEHDDYLVVSHVQPDGDAVRLDGNGGLAAVMSG